MGKLSPHERRKREQAQAATAKRRAAELWYYQGRRLAYAMTLGNPDHKLRDIFGVPQEVIDKVRSELNEWLKV